MTLRDDELRSLAEIERSLTATDPDLARRLAELRPLTPGSAAALIAGSLAMHASGIVIALAGARIDSPVTAAIGAALAIGFPALAVWHLWWRRR
ncbi:DUF3040 domain-containing protein [Kutzneria kofuensis]|jgi:hypothetical protein|uniref:DUF3040 domain-containing protein n=1 Tax=Kutzneria kofuensis TaxID=103725 RepID=A0A7W9KA22_9PSEU|nr:DUF3040 domain-containing protein [Kutzneria kofuensis]MBB5888812.1 hypothetical protein [Kutzneria kofuensis]